mmetsp:Transcript_4321/g.3621  ORF Transcript_4321/g.3621 Transcript_4321/m.3621 type:complete len:140 (+) Transcript_4321:71-490(+)
MTKTLHLSSINNNQKQQQNLINYDREIDRKNRTLVKKMKNSEQRINMLKDQTEKDILIKAEINKMKQMDINNERDRLRRMQQNKKELVTDKHQQIGHSLMETKMMSSYLEKVKTEKDRKMMKQKDELMDKMERSFIWNK